jgi:hypothetical protein
VLNLSIDAPTNRDAREFGTAKYTASRIIAAEDIDRKPHRTSLRLSTPLKRYTIRRITITRTA